MTKVYVRINGVDRDTGEVMPTPQYKTMPLFKVDFDHPMVHACKYVPRVYYYEPEDKFIAVEMRTDRVLTKAEIDSLTLNPYQFLLPAEPNMNINEDGVIEQTEEEWEAQRDLEAEQARMQPEVLDPPKVDG